MVSADYRMGAHGLVFPLRSLVITDTVARRGDAWKEREGEQEKEKAERKKEGAKNGRPQGTCQRAKGR